MKNSELIEKAISAMRQAYCPYSKYPVGAALLTEDGAIYTGANIENASYGLTICAERSAISAAVTAGKRDFKAIAIVTESGKTPFPCGACLQVMSEFCSKDLIIISALANQRSTSVENTLGDLLTTPFGL